MDKEIKIGIALIVVSLILGIVAVVMLVGEGGIAENSEKFKNEKPFATSDEFQEKNADFPMQIVSDSLQQKREEAEIASIRTSMNSAYASAIYCYQDGKTILSGIGGESVCGSSSYKWPIISSCGSNPSDTKWVVFNGDNAKWDYVLECRERTDCSGPKKAICNIDGCKFFDSCEQKI